MRFLVLCLLLTVCVAGVICGWIDIAGCLVCVEWSGACYYGLIVVDSLLGLVDFDLVDFCLGLILVGRCWFVGFA